MRMDKTLAVLLTLLAVLALDLRGRIEELPAMQADLAVIKDKVTRDSFILEQQDELRRNMDEAGDELTRLRKGLFPANLPVSKAQKQMQDILQKAMDQAAMAKEIVRWGEPFRPRDADYQRLPVSFSATGYPEDIVAFVNALREEELLLRFHSLHMHKRGKDMCRIDATVIGFQYAPEDAQSKGGN